jgi:sterol desaturase/sphingolipid hydroxylase (fatty acid hydroxylase superfamily)
MILLIVCSAAVLMITLEIFAGGRKWPKIRGWWTRALLLNGFQFLIAYLGPLLWDQKMASLRPWSAESLGTTGGAVLGYVVITFLFYWWHRFRHQSDFLWRWFHQVHHSPQRIEIITSFYKHPFEIFANSLLTSAILYFVVGLSPLTAAYAVLLTGLAELFYHWNVATPYWLGFFIQRPESHCVHHQSGLHRNNYGDLPLWDMMFGTFDNPKKWNASCGFENQSEHQLMEMIRGKKVL